MAKLRKQSSSSQEIPTTALPDIIFMLLFFFGLSLAAFSSLVAMMEVVARTFIDAGMKRERAIILIGSAGFLLGIPSALSMKFLDNQDWVWGVALMVAGLFFALSISAYGIKKFREEQLNHPDSNIKIGRWWDFIIRILAPLQMAFLLIWFLYQSWKSNPKGWLLPFDSNNVFNVGTVLFQFAIVLGLLILFNKWIVRKSSNN